MALNLERISRALIAEFQTCNKSPVFSRWHPFTRKSGTPVPTCLESLHMAQDTRTARLQSQTGSFHPAWIGRPVKIPSLRCATNLLSIPPFFPSDHSSCLHFIRCGRGESPLGGRLQGQFYGEGNLRDRSGLPSSSHICRSEPSPTFPKRTLRQTTFCRCATKQPAD